MIASISSWANGIIVAIIITTIVEMLLPEGNNKKYIKTVIGIYIVFVVISPIITKVYGKDFDISKIIEYDKLLKNNTSKEINENITYSNEQNINNIFEISLKTDITKRLKEKGYETEKIELKIENQNINSIIINVGVTPQPDLNTQTQSEINQITPIQSINISKTHTQSETKTIQLTQTQKSEIKQYLNTIYEVKTENIFIN